MKKITINKFTILRIAWLAFFIILLNFFDISGIQTGSLLAMFALTLYCYFFQIRTKFKTLFTSKWYFIFFLFITLSFVWSIDRSAGSSVYEAVTRTLIYALCLDLFCDSKENTDYMLNVLIAAGVLYAIHVLLVTPISAYGTARVGVAVNAQRNFVGQVCSLTSIIAFVKLMNEKNHRLIWLFSTIICYAVACITGSRKAFLMFPFAIVLYIFTLKNVNKKIKYLLLTIAIGIIFLFIYLQSSYLQEYFGDRLFAIFDDDTDDASVVMREYLGQTAVSLFLNSPIIGNGCYAVAAYLNSIGFDFAVYAHNNYLEILADYGLIGIFLYYRFHIKVLWQSIKNKFTSMYYQLIFVFIAAIMLMDYGQVSYQKNMYIFMLVIVCSSLKWDNSEDEGKMKEL